MGSSNTFYIQLGFVGLSAVICGAKILIVCQDSYAKGKDLTLVIVDILTSVFCALCGFGFIAAYIILYWKFLDLINKSNGFLDFMKTQTHWFFGFIFMVLALKTGAAVAAPIEFDILSDLGGHGDKDVLTKSQVTWLNIIACTQSLSEISFNILMIIYLIQPFMEKESDEKMVCNQAVRVIAGSDAEIDVPETEEEE